MQLIAEPGSRRRHGGTPGSGGFTLLEVLVALVVLSVGLLGTASMQLDGLRSLQRGVFRTEATWLAHELQERMRVNGPGAQAGEYDGASTTSDTDCSGIANLCNPAAMAAFDRASWHDGLQRLPGGRGDVADLGDGRFRITVRWDEAHNGASGEACPPLGPDDLRCFEVEVLP